jgi:hypothetical protein
MEPNITSVVDHNAGQTSPEGDQGAPMPSATTKPVESSEEGLAADLPEGVSERTQKEFEKLKESNRQLKAQLDQTPQESVYDIFKAMPEMPTAQHVAPAGAQAVQPSAYVDEYGNVDAARFNAALAEANARAEEASKIANEAINKVQASEQSRQEKEAYAKHPQLDKRSPEFDKNFFQLVKNQVIANYASGIDSDLSSIADSLSTIYRPTNVEAVKEEAVKNYKEVERKKSASGSPSTAQRPSTDMTDEELRESSNAGDELSLAKRLQKAGI